ncbi:MAG TPA: hypothetical protein VFB42_03840 [Gaiellaceae bacterium]|nr:hypothetical protein [Gaiellaceae bacterium]
MRARLAATVLGALALALPAQASAHGRGSVVALDYRLRLASVPAGVHARILDGDRALEARVDPGRSLLVRGLVREPMLRFDARGVFANAASPTAQAARLVRAGPGWVRVATGRRFAWHDHRLTPAGPAGRIVVPVLVDGRAGAIRGSFVRVPRPPLLPWLAGAAALAAVAAAVARRRAARAGLTLALGSAAGLAALVATIAFALRDRPGGGAAWTAIGVALAVALGFAVALAAREGRGRARTAGAAGAVAAAVTLPSLPVFWHGVVISALPSDVVRLACAVAVVAGACAAAASLLPELDG